MWCRNSRLSVLTSLDQEVDAEQEVVRGHVPQGLFPRCLHLPAGLCSNVPQPLKITSQAGANCLRPEPVEGNFTSQP